MAALAACAAIAALAAPGAAARSPFAWRGIVEGAYGNAWTHAERARVLAWMPRHGFNAYVHAPKNDLFQRTNWRDPYPAAEQAYLSSLNLGVQLGNRGGEASTLDQLGLLYSAMGRLEEAVRFHRQAAEVRAGLTDLAGEGISRGNAADTLVKLGRHDEARRELLRAIECRQPFGHAGEPWKTFAILSDLERAVGNPAAAAEARGRAIQAYLAYRRDGGENQSPSPQLAAAVARAILSGETGAVAADLAQRLERTDLPGYLRALIPALQAVLGGSRDPALADDPDLDYDDAAELLLLLETLAAPPSS